MDRHFAESFLNRDDHRVLGLRLRPLSLWHMLNLEIVASPYFVGGRFPTEKDLRVATNICRSAFPALPRLTNKGLIWDWLQSYGCEFLTETVKFRTYLDDFNSLPQLWQGERQATTGRQATGLPWALAIVTSVCGATGWAAEAVWNMPVGQAYWYHVAFAMQAGGQVDLLNEDEKYAIEQVQKRRAAGK